MLVTVPPPPPPLPSGPTVPPLILTKSPAVVVHISPFAGPLGAVPCGSLIDALLVVQAGAINKPEKSALERILRGIYNFNVNIKQVP
jgi:hypothetical protein